MVGSFRVKRSSVGQVVYEQVKRLILQHVIEPGEKIGLVSLAEKLEVSLTPLREALTRLKEEGFVVHHPNRGYFAAEITAQEAKELFEVREAIESYALTLGISQVNEQGLRAMVDAVEEHARAMLERDAFFEDKILHLRLAAPARNQLLLRMLEQVLDRAIMKLHIGALPRERGPAAYAEHLDILEAVRRRDAEGAIRHLRKHLSNSRDYILAFLSEHGKEQGKVEGG
jgi:DNA-binding GntR family transcriptional regulator